MYWELLVFGAIDVINIDVGGCACGSRDHMLQTQLVFSESEDWQEWMIGCIHLVDVEITYEYDIPCFEWW